MFKIKNKTVLICGASQGIGAACAKLFSENECKIIALARSEKKLVDLMKTLKPTQKHDYIVGDLSKKENYIEKLRTHKYRDDITVLINNSGGPASGELSEAEDNEFIKGFQQHIIANHNLSKLLLPNMKRANYGRIINIISTSVKVPIANLGVSNTIRSAVGAWSKTLSMEVGKYGVTVNNILPGFTKTPRLKSLISSSATRLGKSTEEIQELWRKSVPSNRFAQPEEVAAAVLFLASDSASYINGVALPVDGGRTGCF